MKDADKKTTGEIIAEARKKKGYTQERLAELLEVTRQAVSRWESNTAYPETEKLVRLAGLLDLDLNYMLTGERTGDVPDGGHNAEPPYYGGWLHIRVPRYEYKSRRTLFGMPLVHVNIGVGFYRAKGIIAIGNIATGLISVGLLSVGLISYGILAVALLAIGVLAVGLFSAGTIAAGLIAAGAIAFGMLTFGAVSVGAFSFGALSIGGYVAVGDHAYGGIALAMTQGHGDILTAVSGIRNTLVYDRVEVLAAIEEHVPAVWAWFKSICSAILG